MAAGSQIQPPLLSGFRRGPSVGGLVSPLTCGDPWVPPRRHCRFIATLHVCSRVLCITCVCAWPGGCGPESGIPDYRSPGRKPYRPIQHAYVTSARAVLGPCRMATTMAC